MQKEQFKTVLLADSDFAINDLVGRHLHDEGVAENIIAICDRDVQVRILENYPIDLLIVDFNDGGKEIVKTARRIRPAIKILVFSGSVRIGLRKTIGEIGGDLLLLKPADKNEITEAARSLLQ